MTHQPLEGDKIDVRLLSEILRQFIPHLLKRSLQKNYVQSILKDELDHCFWYHDALVIANAYRILSSAETSSGIEIELLRVLNAGNLGENALILK